MPTPRFPSAPGIWPAKLGLQARNQLATIILAKGGKVRDIQVGDHRDAASQVVADGEGLTAQGVGGDPAVEGYMVDIVGATRSHSQVEVGASPRGSLALLKVSRARAAMAGRDFVTPDDVKTVAQPALAHRLILKPDPWIRGVRTATVLADVLAQVPVPKVP